MGEDEHKAIKAFINSRQELAMCKLATNPKYQEICKQLEVSGEAADIICIYHKNGALVRQEWTTISRSTDHLFAVLDR